MSQDPLPPSSSSSSSSPPSPSASGSTVSPASGSKSKQQQQQQSSPPPSTSTSQPGSPAMTMVAPAAPPPLLRTMTDSSEPPGFDLPPMPVPYEDFHFSLDLPDNVQASDLSSLETADFHTLFGNPSATGTPSVVEQSTLFGTATPVFASTPVASHATLPKPPSQATTPMLRAAQHHPQIHPPRPHSSDDTVMDNLAGPSSSGFQPPPPPDFQPPNQGSGMFSFDSIFGAGGSGHDSQAGHSNSSGSDSTTPTGGQQQQAAPPLSTVGQASQHGTAPWLAANNMPYQQQQQFYPPAPLFDTSESDFLSNFLEGFEASWDFNPSLPGNMPSFAAAAAQQAARSVSQPGYPGAMGYEPTGMTASSSVGGFAPAGPSSNNGGRRRPNRKDSRHSMEYAQSMDASRHPPGMPFHPPHQHLSHEGDDAAYPSRAFGDPLHDMDEDEADYGQDGISKKRSFVKSRIGEEKRRGSVVLAQHHSTGGMDGYHSGPSTSHRAREQSAATTSDQQTSTAADGGEDDSSTTPTNRRELLTEKEKRQNHILSEQRRRNHIREGFTELVSLLDLGRLYGARGLGLNSGAGTGIEDEGLDDRTDISSDEDSSSEESLQIAKSRRKKARAKKNALIQGAEEMEGDVDVKEMRIDLAMIATASVAAGGRGRGKGRGRGGSAGGGAGSKSAVLFQAVDLITWLGGRNEELEKECEILERESGLGKGPIAGSGGTTADGAAASKNVVAAAS